MNKPGRQERGYLAGNRHEYGDGYDRLKWISKAEAVNAFKQREKLLAWLEERGSETLCSRTKIQFGGLSPGCQSCIKGDWSCLFINGICNGHCFFCPTDQSDLGEATTQTISFTDPRDYCDYLDRLHFQGASISGGEPLMSKERTLRFISSVKRRFGQNIHLWLYTNGTLLTAETLTALRESGLDEIRFNLYAGGKTLKKISMAARVIPYVTVEIPAIPEQIEGLKRMLSRFKDSGVHFLNLHQLRLTPHNFRHLVKRNYTFIHGPKVTVLESELAALKVMTFNVDRGIHIPINYCSFAYKNRYQLLSSRRRHAAFIMKPHETSTESGIIRDLSAKGPPNMIRRQIDILRGLPTCEGTWLPYKTGDGFSFHPSLWPCIDFRDLTLVVRYHDTAIRSSVSYRNMFREIRLNENKGVFVERWPLCGAIELPPESIMKFGKKYLDMKDDDGKTTRRKDHGAQCDGRSYPWSDIDRLERMPRGLARYY